MADFDLQEFRDLNTRMEPLRKILLDLNRMTDLTLQAVQVRAQAEKGLKPLIAQSQRAQADLDRLREERAKLEKDFLEAKTAHERTLTDIVERNQAAKDTLDRDLQEHMKHVRAEMDRLSAAHKHHMQTLASERTVAQDSLDTVKEQLTKMTASIRQNLGI